MLDKKYWEDYYLKCRNEISTKTCHPDPSMFCKFIIHTLPQYTQKPWCILDAGCGNGRDTYALAKHAQQITGVDSCGFLPSTGCATHICFKLDDFTNCAKDDYNIIYSRFTFHSIDNEQQNIFLDSIQKAGTILCIETRSDKGKDEKRLTGDAHYRNFTNIDRLQTQLEEYQFKVVYISEGRNVAVYKEENPVCIRVIAIKSCS